MERYNDYLIEESDCINRNAPPPIFNFPQGFPPQGFPSQPFPPGMQGGQGMPPPPPNFIPSKQDKGVNKFNVEEFEKMHFGSGGISPQVSPQSIRFCLFKNTFIWERGGRSYWAFLIHVDRRTVTGFRWFRRNWVFFGLELRRIDSFICFRDNSNYIIEKNRDSNENQVETVDKEYSAIGSFEIFTKVLCSVDIKENKRNIISSFIGRIDNNDIEASIEGNLERNTTYRIIMQIKYPNEIEGSTKERIKEEGRKSFNNIYSKILTTKKDMDSNLEFYYRLIGEVDKITDDIQEEFDKTINSKEDILYIRDKVALSIRSERVIGEWK